MTLDQLETFLAIAKEGGLRAASKVLYKTQPTLSVSIKNLEDELGITLLDREEYRVKLTKAGEALYIRAQDIIEKVHEFQTLAKELTMGSEPQLNLAIDYLCPMNFLLSILHQFSQTCLNTKIEMDFEILTGAENKLLNGQANIAITPFISKHSKIEFETICEIKIIPVIASSVFKNKKISFEDLLKLPQIIVKDSSKEKSDINFGSHSEASKWIVSDHHIKRELILNGFGWGHLEESSIKQNLKQKDLIEIKLKEIAAKTMPLYITKLKSSASGPIANDLWDHIISKFKKI